MFERKDMPIGNFYFSVEIDGIQEGNFLKASGVASEVEVEEYEEGGVNHFTHKIPVRIKHSNIVLEKGVTSSKELLKWFSQIQEGIIIKKNFSIILWNQGKEIVRRWNFYNGYPVKWEAGELDALGTSILVERIEITHEGMKEST
ncbi:phage tail protein [Wukongibacter baidiensis]|uniref:phage tail protein n=1 Tax=Wukongibacter baidiensis TaxID=1723361 RepID=UPI003D7F8863